MSITKPTTPSSAAATLLTEFAKRTGLTEEAPPRRYLWTDAFAVCTFLSLERELQGDGRKHLAIRLIDQVHWVLGRHRPDDPRTGWISGLAEEKGEEHPTAGGLRIGKPLPEPAPGQRSDSREDWDRDGQYFHYLTKWMHALDQTRRATGEVRYGEWARELAATAHRTFVVRSGRRATHMDWKMSIDLSRPLVPSMGHHDPLDGLITCEQLAAAPAPGSDLAGAIADFETLCAGRNWATDDPLGLGGLLSDAWRLAQLIGGSRESTNTASSRGARHLDLLGNLLDASLAGLRGFANTGAHTGSAAHRLAFRELGLSIGLHGLENLHAALAADQALRQRSSTRLAAFQLKVDMLLTYLPMADEIERFWLDPNNRTAESWTDHEDINAVMLAASLAPGGYLNLFEAPLVSS